ncbi:MAG: replicative DNA helicase [Lachnospiraceae bacterium]|nr:replicative DNA helicase [Lachnospiraceae bacterium]
MDEEFVKRVLPHSIEAEQSVIGSMLYSPDAVQTAAEMLTGEDFYQRQYGVLFETMKELYESGRPTDVVTLQDALKRKDVAPETYSLDFLKELLNASFISANIRSYAQIVLDKSMLRKTIRTLEEITNTCYLGKEKTGEIMADTEKKVFDLLETREGTGTAEPVNQTVLRVIERIEEAAKNGGAVSGLPTGFSDLDYRLSGLQKSDLVLIAARPSMGKTALALNFVDSIAIRQNVPIAMFSLEMSREQLVNRLLAMESHVDSQKLRTGQLTDLEWDDIVAGSAQIAKSKIVIDDTPGISVSELRTRCRKYKLEYGIKVVVIDYLQLMSGNSRTENRQQEISEISRSLKAVARELDVPVIALSQLSRACEARSDHRPMLSDLRDSGAIEQDADVVMFLYRDEVYNPASPEKGIAEIIVAKQRNGPIGTVKLAWIPELTKFANLEFRKSAGNGE